MHTLLSVALVGWVLLHNSVMSACNNNTKLGSTLIPPILFPYWYNFQLFPLNFLWTCVLQNKPHNDTIISFTDRILMIHKKTCNLKKLVKDLWRKTIKKSVSFDSSSYLLIQCSTSFFIAHFCSPSAVPGSSPIYSFCLQKSMKV